MCKKERRKRFSDKQHTAYITLASNNFTEWSWSTYTLCELAKHKLLLHERAGIPALSDPKFYALVPPTLPHNWCVSPSGLAYKQLGEVNALLCKAPVRNIREKSQRRGIKTTKEMLDKLTKFFMGTNLFLEQKYSWEQSNKAVWKKQTETVHSNV